MGKVFVSYSHPDTAVADRVVDILLKKGVEYFRDVKDLAWGDSVKPGVQGGLREASALVVLVSPASLKSHWVWFEVGFASALRLRVLPFLTHPSIDPPDILRDLLYTADLAKVEEYFTDWNPAPPPPVVEEPNGQPFKRLAGMMPALFAEMRDDVSKEGNELVREFVNLRSPKVMFGHDKPRFEYFEETHPDLTAQLDLLEDAGFVRVVRDCDYGTKIYRMSEAFVRMLRA